MDKHPGQDLVEEGDAGIRKYDRTLSFRGSISHNKVSVGIFLPAKSMHQYMLSEMLRTSK